MTPKQCNSTFPLSSLTLQRFSLLMGGALLLASTSAAATSIPLTPASLARAEASSLPSGQLPVILGQVGAEDDVVVDTEEDTSSGPSSGGTTANATTRFRCQASNGQYTVVYLPESQPNQAYAWATPTALGGGWTPQKRCEAISSRLESYRPDGLLEMQTGIENNHNVVCVTTEKDPNCRIIFTVPPGQDATLTRDRVFENLTIADSGQQTQGVSTFTDNGRNTPLPNALGQLLGVDLSTTGNQNNWPNRSGNLNLKPFLDPADGGTGTMLRGRPLRQRSNPQLNPDRFR